MADETRSGTPEPSTAAAKGRNVPQASDDAGHPAARSLAQLDNSQKAIRDTTKWLVAAAAAVGAIVVAGLQLSNLPRGFIATLCALGGFAIALVGVAAIIFSATSVLSVGYTTLGQLADLYKPEAHRQLAIRELTNTIARLEQSSSRRSRYTQTRKIRVVRRLRIRTATTFALMRLSYLKMVRPFRTRLIRMRGARIAGMVRYLDRDAAILSNGLASDIPELYDRIQVTDQEVLIRRGDKPTSRCEPRWVGETVKDSGERLEQAEWRISRLDAAAGQLIAFANQRLIEDKFSNLKRSVQMGGLLVALGVGLFVAAPKFAAPREVAVDKPTSVTILVNDPTKFGVNCTLQRLSAVAFGGTWEEPVVVTEPAGDCQAKRVKLTPNIGVAVPVADTAPAPSPQPTSTR